MKKTNVLIFPAGEVNSVELHDALSHNVNIEVFGCSSEDRHGGFVFKNYMSGLPNIAEEAFIEKFNFLLNKWQIDFIFPTHDTVALFLVENQNKISAKVISADLRTAEICRDKKKTYAVFTDCGFCPVLYDGFTTFPVFIKPRNGQGGKGAKLIRDTDDIPADFSKHNYLICEYLPGEEFTVDCLTDSSGKLAACLPRLRKRMLAGICVNGEPAELTDEIREMAEGINSRLGLLGSWSLQIKGDKNGKLKLLEISARCAGSMCLTRARGVNLPLLSVYVAQGKQVSVFENRFKLKMDRTLISRYQLDCEIRRVYMDYDDTLVEGEYVCVPAIKFVYQCRNRGIKIILLTRHETDHDDTVEENMLSHSITPKLFHQIIKLEGFQKKKDYIRPDGSIFIDNSYQERKEVHDAFEIPVFDVEGIEVLDDWRC